MGRGGWGAKTYVRKLCMPTAILKLSKLDSALVQLTRTRGITEVPGMLRVVESDE